jgi:hypothetical protein
VLCNLVITPHQYPQIVHGCKSVESGRTLISNRRQPEKMTVGVYRLWNLRQVFNATLLGAWGSKHSI